MLKISFILAINKLLMFRESSSTKFPWSKSVIENLIKGFLDKIDCFRRSSMSQIANANSYIAQSSSMEISQSDVRHGPHCNLKRNKKKKLTNFLKFCVIIQCVRQYVLSSLVYK